MADVNGESRAQLFLVGALSLAVVFVVLALILNSAIYTENLATRGTDNADGREITQFQHDVEQGVGGLVAFANRNRAGYTDQTTVLQGGVGEIRSLSQAFNVEHGRVVSVEYVGITEGTEARQYSERQFTNDSDSSTWVAAAGVDEVRSFNQTVNPVSLTDTDLSTLSGDPFFVSFEDEDDGDVTNDWRVYLYQDVSESEMYVGVVSPSGAKHSCGPYPYTEEDRVNVSITGSTVAGQRCPPLDFTDDLSGPYDIEYHEGDSAVGTYRFVVDQDRGTFTGNLPSSSYQGDAGDPTSREVLYSATVRVTYHSSNSLYETEVTAIPGETDA
ncbi:hypothetical protein [Halogranum rubrum]|uniref:Uncharacterized protein n=1 Tax=Halogranum salarium B-1 TaxID=1210908 RepID=J3EY99_9EURY|nr:hypothetical protein [Halogranum salarium]EJN60267.1 hypothetical protein HSB1_08700 [Halogranum salarium B-1]